MLVQQLLRHQHEARRAEAALKRAGLDKRFLHRIEPAIGGEMLDRDNLGAIGERRQVQTARYRIPVDQYRAAAAQSLSAAFTRAEQVEMLAQYIDQAEMRRNGHLDGAAVQREADRARCGTHNHSSGSGSPAAARSAR